MGIFSRTRDIFAANFTELLDRAEDPARMIRMIILEMEETLVEVRASAARSIADRKEMDRALARLNELQSSWTEKAELALSKDREDLAKAALIERQKAAEMAGGLRDELNGMEQVLRGYEADIAKLQGKLREARARQNAIAARFESALARARAREIMHGSRTADAFAKFELLERRADFAEGCCEALGITSLEDEIDQLRADEKIDAELSAMRAALKTRAN
jgi:phage shock protein A